MNSLDASKERALFAINDVWDAIAEEDFEKAHKELRSAQYAIEDAIEAKRGRN